MRAFIMKISYTAALLTAGAAATLMAPSVATAAPLLAGSTAAANSSLADPAAGTLVDSTGPVNFAGFAFSGVVQQDVYQETLSANPLGGLTFAYRLSNSSASQTSLQRLSAFDFDLFQVDATTFVIAAGDQSPTNFNRAINGKTVAANFNGADELIPGESSTLLIFRTNAPSYTAGVISIIDGGGVAVSGFAPIPEPGSLIFIAAGAALLLRPRRAS